MTDPFYGLGGLRTVDYIDISSIPAWDGENTDYVRNDRVDSTRTSGTYYILSIDSLDADLANVDPEIDTTSSWTILTQDDLDALSFRDTISPDRRQLGMVVYVENNKAVSGSDIYFKLNNFIEGDRSNLNSGNWEELLSTDNIVLSDTTNFPQDTTAQDALDDLSIRIGQLSSGTFQGNWDPNTEPIPIATDYIDGDFWRVSVDYTGTLLDIGGVEYDNDSGTPEPPIVINDLIYYEAGSVPDILDQPTLEDDFFLLDVSASPNISDLLQTIVTRTVTEGTDPADPDLSHKIRQVVSTDSAGRINAQNIIREDADSNPSITIGDTDGIISTTAAGATLGSDINIPAADGAISGNAADTVNNFLDNLNDFVGVHLNSLVSPSSFKGEWDPNTGVIPVTTEYNNGDFWRVSADYIGTTVLNVGGDVFDADPDTEDIPPLAANNIIFYLDDSNPGTTLTDDFFIDAAGSSRFVQTDDLIHDIAFVTDFDTGTTSTMTNTSRRQLVATDASGTSTSVIAVQEDEANTPSVSISDTGVLHTDSRIIRLGENTPNGDGRINLPPVSGAISADSPIVIRDFLNTLNDYVGIHLSNLFGGASLRGDWDPNTGVVPIIPPMITLADGDFWRASADLTGSLTVGGDDYDTDPDTDPPLISENDLIYYNGGDSGDLANYFIVGPDEENTSDLIRSLNPNIFENGGGNDTNIQRIRYTTVHGHDKFVQVIKEDPINNPSVQIHADSDGVGRLTTAANRITLGTVLSAAAGLITGQNTPNPDVADTAILTIHDAIDDLNDADARDMDLGSGFTGAGTTALINADANDSVRNVINALNNDTFTTIRDLTFADLDDTPDEISGTNVYPDGFSPQALPTDTSEVLIAPVVNGSADSIAYAPLFEFNASTQPVTNEAYQNGTLSSTSLVNGSFSSSTLIPFDDSTYQYLSNFESTARSQTNAVVDTIIKINEYTLTNPLQFNVSTPGVSIDSADLLSVVSFDLVVTRDAVIVAHEDSNNNDKTKSYTTSSRNSGLGIGQWIDEVIDHTGDTDREIRLTLNEPVTRSVLTPEPTSNDTTIQLRNIVVAVLFQGTNTTHTFQTNAIRMVNPQFDSMSSMLTGTSSINSFIDSFNEIELTFTEYSQPVSNFSGLTTTNTPNTTFPSTILSANLDAGSPSNLSPITDSVTITLDDDDAITIGTTNAQRPNFAATLSFTHQSIRATPLDINTSIARNTTLSLPEFGYNVWQADIPVGTSTDLAQFTLDNLRQITTPNNPNYTFHNFAEANNPLLIQTISDLDGEELLFSGLSVARNRVLIINQALVGNSTITFPISGNPAEITNAENTQLGDFTVTGADGDVTYQIYRINQSGARIPVSATAAPVPLSVS